MDTKKILIYMRDACMKKGISGIMGLATIFRRMDKDYSEGIQFEEFKKGFEEYGIIIPKGDLKSVFYAFDTDNSESIDFREFLDVLKPPIPECRKRVIDEVFNKLDFNQDGQLKVEDVEVTYKKNALKHPDYLEGKKTLDEVLAMFLLHFDDPERPDGVVTRDEFHDYYTGVSVTVNDDCYFDMMMRTMWDLPNKSVTYG